jgi:hypothetical protein
MADFGIYRGFSEKLFEGQIPVNVGKEGSVTIPSGVAPVALEATGIGSTSFTANWEAFPDAYVYLLDVSTSPTFDTFVYENQQVLAPSTSYVVIGLNSSTTYYYRVRASTEALTDPDAQAFFDRVDTAGGTLSSTEQAAVNQLVLDMKADGIWTKMKAIYPMVGASAAACAQNLKSSSFTGSFTSGWTFASTGVTPNGTSAYMDTNFVISDQLNYLSQSYGIYKQSVSTQLSCEFGVSDSEGFEGVGSFLYSGYNYINTFVLDQAMESTLVSGNYILNRNGSAVKKLFRNGSLFDSKTDTYTSSNDYNYLGYSVWLGGRNDHGSVNYTTNTNTSFFSIGDGLTDTEASNYYTAVQAFQTTLSREV